MGSFPRIIGGIGAFVLAGITLGAAPSPAQAMPRLARAVTAVPCDPDALVTAIRTANGAGVGTLLLSPICVYNYVAAAAPGDALPIITGDITLVGGLNTTIRRDPTTPNAFRVLEVASGATLRVRRISIVGGSTTNFGGGILNAGTVVLDHTVLAGNQASNGGAFANYAGANATISHSVLNENSAGSVGGGAIINFGTLTMSNSILNKNTAPINGGGLNTQPNGVSHLIQSIVVNNTSGSLGGGTSNLGTTDLEGLVVTGNKGSGGGGIATGNADVSIRKSIVDNNVPDNCSPLNTIQGCVD
ncbi:hypothetical protein GCM10023194_21560 [Planotetraspora phitsanulokensis]|uniref:Uncharacterized protein n=2 Tax=Planotetraspora phitsanulokensis TaxID=575192 RepID=A0A8J3U4C7_9ACTN|nr:hypothetical protein Pph01_32170 [Planotetraspora phitsanulokensis]